MFETVTLPLALVVCCPKLQSLVIGPVIESSVAVVNVTA